MNKIIYTVKQVLFSNPLHYHILFFVMSGDDEITILFKLKEVFHVIDARKCYFGTFYYTEKLKVPRPNVCFARESLPQRIILTDISKETLFTQTIDLFR